MPLDALMHTDSAPKVPSPHHAPILARHLLHWIHSNTYADLGEYDRDRIKMWLSVTAKAWQTKTLLQGTPADFCHDEILAFQTGQVKRGVTNLNYFGKKRSDEDEKKAFSKL